jgi:hypothetical protein
MGQYSNYDVVRGLERVVLLYLVLTIALLGLLSLQLYKSLQAQDSSLSRGTAADIRSQAESVIHYPEARPNLRPIHISSRCLDEARLS